MRVHLLEQEISEKRGKRWDLRWTLVPAFHGKDGFRCPRTKASVLGKGIEEVAKRTGWGPEKCVTHLMCWGWGEGVLLLEGGHLDGASCSFVGELGVELPVTEDQSVHSIRRTISLSPSLASL